ncbi:MAG TPA: hypothetical protein VNZ22_11750 [Bacillota bacterium]|nr:hypothetical protein [Bacillota bacterium]
MRRLIRNIKTRLFYTRGEWAPEARRAQSFPDALAAVQTNIREALPDVEIVLPLNDEPSELYDIHRPLNGNGGKQE